jgi:uncharacterized membrane protein
MSVNYSLASTICKAIEDIADQLAGTEEAADDAAAHRRQRRFSLALNTLAIGVGLIAQKQLGQKDDESDIEAVSRTGATWLTYAGVAGLMTGLLQEGIEMLRNPKAKSEEDRVTRFPVGVIGGALLAIFTENKRRRAEKNIDQNAADDIDSFKAIGMGVGVLGALGAVSYGQRKFADLLSSRMGKLLPGSEDFWWSTGNAAAVIGTGFGIVTLMKRVYRRVEEVAARIEPAYLQPPSSPLVSSGDGSLVSWDTLSVQGRRFVSSATPKQQIRDVMGLRTAAEPIRIFVGLDSAETEVDRLDLALHEMERTKAFERQMIMLISPTGTGYVNYVAVEAAEIMSKGNLASVVLQYSKRPSPMSLDRVPEGRKQFKMLVKAVSRRIAALPANKRPQLVVFGESLGAWTSQDAFISQGTDGLIAAGIDRALWIGTPYGSKWKTQVLGPPEPDVEPELVGAFDNSAGLRKLPKAKRDKLRYVMITHYNDAVALFGASLLAKKPDWLIDPEKRPPTVSKSQYYTSPGTFLLTLIDMKNAMNVIPGQFEASGHDYRADLAAFVRDAYGFSAAPAQMTRIEKVLRQNELDRAERLTPPEDE